MKKSILLSLGVMFMATSGFSVKYYTRICQNGAEGGYSRVSNTTNTDPGNGDVYHSIACFDPGSSECPKAVALNGNGGLSVNAQNICANYALSEIGNGVLSGSQQMQISGEGNFLVTWTSYDTQGLTSNIHIVG